MNAGSNIISVAIRNVLHDRSTYLAFPKRALFDPLGMSSAVLETDAAGTFIGSSYIYATARERARFGMLYLRDGIWNGARILPPGWVDYTRTPAPADEASGMAPTSGWRLRLSTEGPTLGFLCRLSMPQGTRGSL